MRLGACLAACLACYGAAYRPHPCNLGPEPALCATLSVWENRVGKAGRRIDLNIVILPAVEKNHARARFSCWPAAS
jgi:hypothetical protein